MYCDILLMLVLLLLLLLLFWNFVFPEKKKKIWTVQYCSYVNSASIFPISKASISWHLHYISSLKNSNQTSINTPPWSPEFISSSSQKLERKKERETHHNFLQLSAATYHLWARFWKSSTCFLSTISSNKLFSILPSIT